MQGTLLLIGSGVLADSLAKLLAGPSVVAERATCAQGPATARVLLPDLIVLAGDAAQDRGKAMLAKLAGDAGSTAISTLVIAAPDLRGLTVQPTPRQIAFLGLEGGTTECARRVRLVAELYFEEGLASCSLQQLVDTVAPQLKAAGKNATGEAVAAAGGGKLAGASAVTAPAASNVQKSGVASAATAPASAKKPNVAAATKQANASAAAIPAASNAEKSAAAVATSAVATPTASKSAHQSAATPGTPQALRTQSGRAPGVAPTPTTTIAEKAAAALDLLQTKRRTVATEAVTQAIFEAMDVAPANQQLVRQIEDTASTALSSRMKPEPTAATASVQTLDAHAHKQQRAKAAASDGNPEPIEGMVATPANDNGVRTRPRLAQHEASPAPDRAGTQRAKKIDPAPSVVSSRSKTASQTGEHRTVVAHDAQAASRAVAPLTTITRDSIVPAGAAAASAVAVVDVANVQSEPVATASGDASPIQIASPSTTLRAATEPKRDAPAKSSGNPTVSSRTASTNKAQPEKPESAAARYARRTTFGAGNVESTPPLVAKSPTSAVSSDREPAASAATPAPLAATRQADIVIALREPAPPPLPTITASATATQDVAAARSELSSSVTHDVSSLSEVVISMSEPPPATSSAHDALVLETREPEIRKSRGESVPPALKRKLPASQKHAEPTATVVANGPPPLPRVEPQPAPSPLVDEPDRSAASNVQSLERDELGQAPREVAGAPERNVESNAQPQLARDELGQAPREVAGAPERNAESNPRQRLPRVEQTSQRAATSETHRNTASNPRPRLPRVEHQPSLRAAAGETDRNAASNPQPQLSDAERQPSPLTAAAEPQFTVSFSDAAPPSTSALTVTGESPQLRAAHPGHPGPLTGPESGAPMVSNRPSRAPKLRRVGNPLAAPSAPQHQPVSRAKHQPSPLTAAAEPQFTVSFSDAAPPSAATVAAASSQLKVTHPTGQAPRTGPHASIPTASNHPSRAPKLRRVGNPLAAPAAPQHQPVQQPWSPLAGYSQPNVAPPPQNALAALLAAEAAAAAQPPSAAQSNSFALQASMFATVIACCSVLAFMWLDRSSREEAAEIALASLHAGTAARSSSSTSNARGTSRAANTRPTTAPAKRSTAAAPNRAQLDGNLPFDENSGARAAAASQEPMNHAEQLVDEGALLFEDGRLGLAEASYLKALKTMPSYPRAMAGLVHVHIERKDGAEAVRWAEQLVASQPKSGPNQLLLGDAQALRGDDAAARAAWNRAIRYGSVAARQRLTPQ